MVTIQNLEVRFDVEGEGDEAAFGRMFLKNMRRWAREESEAKARKRDSDKERSLGGQNGSEAES
ncbi:MAG: putative phage tail protein [Bryobacteraceae bacterium]